MSRYRYMENPLDLDTFDPTQVKMNHLSQSEMEQLFMAAMAVGTQVRRVVMQLPFAHWQRVAYEMRVRADTTKDPVHEYMASTMWILVDYLQTQGRLSDSAVNNQELVAAFKKYGVPLDITGADDD